LLSILGAALTMLAGYRFYNGQLHAYAVIAALMAWIFSLIFMALGILTEQNLLILKRGWRK